MKNKNLLKFITISFFLIFIFSVPIITLFTEDKKISEKEKLSQRRAKIKDLLAQGLKRKDICLQLDISIKTYKRDISFLKEQGLI